jgi:branched-chain amino acid transport system permease protein
MAVERFLLRRFYRCRPDPRLLLLTFGLAMVAEQSLRILYGAPPSPSRSRRRCAARSSSATSSIRATADAAPGDRRGSACSACGSCCTRTAFGKVVRAGVQNPDMVGALGISLKPYMTAVVMIGVGLAALAGVLIAPIAGVHPAMGQEIITFAFVVVVIGGLGSFWGVVAAAAIVGMTRGVAAHFYPAATEASVYLLMVLVLLMRPRGLFGERIQKFE